MNTYLEWIEDMCLYECELEFTVIRYIHQGKI